MHARYNCRRYYCPRAPGESFDWWTRPLHSLSLHFDPPSMASLAGSHGSFLAARPRCLPLTPTFLQASSPSSSSTLQFSSPHSSLSSVGIGLVHVAREIKDRSSFAQTSAVRELVGSLTRTEGLRFAIVVARFNEIVTRPLLEGALDTFRRYSVNEDIDVVWVPGSYELGIVAQKLGKSGKYHAIVCIGAVVRGDTTHYDAVANSAASGVLSAGINSGVPCIFGVLTCEDMDQAINRAGGKSGNKGSEAALTAIEMASLFEHHLKQ